jgi:hypothetical protein
MNAARLILKQPTGWFTAGRELQQAIRLLSDSAFKLSPKRLESVG